MGVVPFVTLAAFAAACTADYPPFAENQIESALEAAEVFDPSPLMPLVQEIYDARITDPEQDGSHGDACGTTDHCVYSRAATHALIRQRLGESNLEGLATVREQARNDGGFQTVNVLVDFPGTARPNEWVLATAHYDAWFKNEKRFYYGGMPTGIVTEPEKYEAWEFSYPDRMDLAAMGRVWYVECQARARMGDAAGLIETVRRVAKAGRESGYYWRERYTNEGGRGAEKYCEYPANLIRIVQRFLLGVDLRIDGTVALSPTVTAKFWKRGFGQRLTWRDRTLEYRMRRGEVRGTYSGGVQPIAVRMETNRRRTAVRVILNGRTAAGEWDGEMIRVTLPESIAERPCKFEIRRAG